MSLRDAAEQKLGVKARIKTGQSGDMTVLVNGNPVFAYKKEGSMLPTEQLLERIAAAGS